jgi:dolichol-phosphate mannosyltransferase
LHSRDGRQFAMWLAQHKLPVATINTIVQLIVPPPKYHVEQLVPHVNVAQTAQLKGMIVIERGGEGNEELSEAEGLEILLQNCDDAYGFPPYNTIRDFLHGATTNNLVAMEQQIIASALAGHPSTLLRSTKMDWSFRIPALADGVIQVNTAVEEPLREREVGMTDLTLGYSTD